jgi:hypothetical protein
MTIHRAQFNGRLIEVETEFRNDGLHLVRTVCVEVRKGKAIVIDEMPYDASAGEATVVDRATMTTTARIKNRM